MTLFKSRKTAAAIFAAVVIIMTPVGTVMSLMRVADDVKDTFTNGVYIQEGGGYTSASIQSLLDEKIKASLGLITVGAQHDELANETDALRSAREKLMSSSSVNEKYIANRELESARHALTAAMKKLGISGSDADNAAAYSAALDDIQGAISINRYNEKVDEFSRDILSRFPANLFSGFISKLGPVRFGE